MKLERGSGIFISMEKIEFFKMHNRGNDYVFIDARRRAVPDPSRLAVEVSCRRFSVGGDGLVLITEAEGADAGMRIFNADGSEGAVCGNALGCVGKYLSETENLAEGSVLTKSGIRRFRVDGDVAVDMGKPLFRTKTLPSVGIFVLPHKGKEYAFTAVSVGNPHAVAVVSDEVNDPAGVAAELASSGLFPEGVNVEFARPTQNGAEVRVIERGSGETACCGSGACAVAAVLARHRILPYGEMTLVFYGGEVRVNVGEDSALRLHTEPVHVFDGVFYYEPTAANEGHGK